MTERKSFVLSVAEYLGTDFLFIFLSCALFAVFLLALFLSVFKPGYGVKKRSWFFVFSFGISALSFSFFYGRGIPFLFLGAGALLSVPLLTIRKKTTVTEEQRSFIDYVDEEIEKELLSSPPEKKRTARETKGKEPDFAHVKSVIKRLSALSLSQTDKKEVKSLESAIFEAEKNGLDADLKERINDGLGLLLKLMAKYGA